MKRYIYTIQQILIILLLIVPISTQAAKKSDSASSTKTKAGAGVLAQSENTPLMSYSDRVIGNFMDYYKIGIDEKLYLQTDKQYYSSGEQIWFKGYLLNAITHTPINFTNFIYVELTDYAGNLVSRVKVKRDEAGFNGHITMDPTIEPGDYTLRGYTRWMANKDTGFFYSKNIKIISAITEMAPSEVDPNDKAAVRAAEREAILAAEEAAKAEEEANRVLNYEVQFFPEGGALLANTPQIVAFKALAEDGISVEVTGTIYNSKHEAVAEIASTHKGMGMFQFTAQEGETYIAAMKSVDGLDMSFYLPKVEPRGVALKVSRVGEKNYYQIITNSPDLIAGAHVVIHSRGQIINVSDAKLEPSAISNSMLHSGITTFAVADANNQVIAERLIFIKPTSTPTLKFNSNAKNYEARSLASFRVSVLDSDGEPSTGGSFAVSVTDNSSIEGDPKKDNMLSYLLLSSDIKGHIEDPGLYFEESSPEMDYKIDLLMRTQAWRRFDLSEVLNGTVEKPETLYEDVAYISGSVKGFFGNEARRPKVAVMCSKVNYLDLFDLDESSRFRLVGLNIPDSATYIVKAQGRNGGGALTLNIDPEEFPILSPGIFSRAEKAAEPPTAFVNQSKDKFFYEGGMQTIELEAISVTTEEVSNNPTGMFATRSTERELLETMSGLTINDVIMTFPSMSVGEEYVYYRNETSPVKFVVDGIDDDFYNLTSLMADDIEQIDFYYGADAAAFSDSSGGVLSITLREVNLSASAEHANMAYVAQLGYQHPAVFFQPGYESASVKATWPPDYRTTIYWDGKIKPDSYGNINFGFYTADKATTYTVTIEGVTDSGEVCRGTTTIERSLASF